MLTDLFYNEVAPSFSRLSVGKGNSRKLKSGDQAALIRVLK